MTDTTDRLISLAATRFGKNAAALTADDDFFQKLGIDSYQAMDLLTQLEDAFGVEIPDYELQGVTTFRGLADVIGRRL
jgi:acyl carrier protein